MRSHLEFETTAPAGVLDAPESHHSSADASSLVRDGIAAAQKGDRERARELLTEATAIDPQCEDAWMWLASISEYPEELLAFLDKVLEIAPSNQRAVEWYAATRSLLAKTFVQRGVDAHSEGAIAMADSFFDQAIAHDDSSVLAWLWKARVACSDEDKIRCLERVLELDPENEEAGQAIAPYREPSPQARLEEARWAAVAGKRKQALELLDLVLEKAPENVDAWILRSHMSVDMNDKLSALEKALEIDPDNDAARAGFDFLNATVAAVAAAEATPETEPLEPAEDRYEPLEMEAADDAVGTAMEPFEDPTASAETAIGPELSAPDDAEIFAEETTDDQQSELSDNTGATAEPTINSPFDGFAIEPPVSHAIELEYTHAIDAAEVPTEEPPVVPADAFDEQPSSDDEIGIEQAVSSTTQVEEPAAACPFCHAPVDVQALECGGCRAVMTLSDIESLLANQDADRIRIQEAVTAMEAEWNLREFGVAELTVLGIGHFNLRDLDQGFNYLKEASLLDPNNVILAAQVNTIAIRLEEMRRQQEIDEAKPKGKSILVIDDSPTVRKLISAKLEKCGHNVTCAADGVEGLERFGDGVPDLVLLDIAMPRMDGYEVCRQIRTNPEASGVPVVMISGKDGFFDKVRGKMAGCTGYVTKPFGPETLMKALDVYLLPENGSVN